MHPHDPHGPVDPDVDLHDSDQRTEWTRHRLVLPVIAVGGMVGATARYAAGEAWPTPEGAVPWATLAVNVSGCLLIGVLMVVVVETRGAHPLLRPFAGVGVLGGFTTFSAYTAETAGLLRTGHPGLALAYWLGTLVLALAGVVVGVVVARTALPLRHRRTP